MEFQVYNGQAGRTTPSETERESNFYRLIFSLKWLQCYRYREALSVMALI